MISHHHKTIFVHIPKTAGQSIAQAFLEDLGLDWDCRAPLLLMPNDQAKVGPPRLAHLTALDYIEKKFVPQDMFDAYFTFSVVRNPYSRVVSMYKFMNYCVPFNRFVLDLLGSKLWDEQYYFVRPQSEFIAGRDGKTIVDEIFKLERLDEDFEKIRARAHLKASLGRKNTSNALNSTLGYRGRLAGLRSTLESGNFVDVLLYLGAKEAHTDWRDYYDITTRGRVEELYGTDIERFDYAFDG